MYTDRNFKTKKALKEALAKGDLIGFYQPNAVVAPPRDGKIFLEGPHYPAPHTWYAQAEAKDGLIIKVK